jgi:hypothetical protein
MARSPKLKVYRTPIGFHDAYVAAPSQKAALEAWGSSHNLFARGVAEIVTDDALTKDPLANPGKVIKRSRGTTAEQIAALPDAPPQTVSRRSVADPPTRTPSARPAQKSTPRPSRRHIESAEKNLAKLREQQADAEKALAAEQDVLDRRRAALEKSGRDRISKAQGLVEQAEQKYAAALRKWRG